jgi:hypothetical protein
MLRLLVGLRILRGPRGPQARRPGSGKRRVMFGICCVLIASAATHSGAGRAASPSAIPPPPSRLVRQIQDPSALFPTAAETHRTLRLVDRIDLSFAPPGSAFLFVERTSGR